MFAVIPRLALAAALTAGAVLALPAAASAAPKKQPCAVGKWKLTQYKLNSKGKNYTVQASGGQGAKLTIAKKTVKFNFDGSKKVVAKGEFEGEAIEVVSVFRKTLTVKSTLKGNKKGSLVLKQKSASGNAKVTESSKGQSLGSYNIAQAYRKGEADPFVPSAAHYTCTAKTLKLSLKGRSGADSVNVVYAYKRG